MLGVCGVGEGGGVICFCEICLNIGSETCVG